MAAMSASVACWAASGSGRFDDAAHAGQHIEEFILRTALHQPVQHVRVEHVPFAAP
jgi:hypothetical protein